MLFIFVLLYSFVKTECMCVFVHVICVCEDMQKIALMCWPKPVPIKCAVRGRDSETSLVPRPHPLTRRNGLVNQVEFLGLVHAFATM